MNRVWPFRGRAFAERRPSLRSGPAFGARTPSQLRQFRPLLKILRAEPSVSRALKGPARPLRPS